MQNSFNPKHFIFCDIESTHKVVAKAEIITIAFIKTDLKFNIIDRISFKMAPTYWTEEHDDAFWVHKITRDDAFAFPNKKEILPIIMAWFGQGETYFFGGHFNRDSFGSWSSFDYALLKQEFLDFCPEMYFDFCQIFPRQFICSSHSIADKAFKNGLIDVPLVVKEGNKKASRDFGLKNLCRIMKVELQNHHEAESDAIAAYELVKKFHKIIDVFDVIKNDWRKEDGQEFDRGENSVLPSALPATWGFSIEDE